MHLGSWAVWPLVGSLAYLGAVVNAAGVLEIDVVFPRTNETYAPTDYFPIIFALQNAELAKHLKPSIRSFVRNGSELTETLGHFIHDLTYANYSSEPYFIYHYLNLNTEGPHELFTTATWRSCDESGDQVAILSNRTNFSVHFNIKRGGQEVDLVAATETCSAQDGVAINVTDQTYEVPPPPSWDRRPSGTCAVLASSSPTLTANPCRVKIDTAMAASMSAELHAALCEGLNPPADCPEEENAVHQLVVSGVVSVAAAFGAIGFLLV